MSKPNGKQFHRNRFYPSPWSTSMTLADYLPTGAIEPTPHPLPSTSVQQESKFKSGMPLPSAERNHAEVNLLDDEHSPPLVPLTSVEAPVSTTDMPRRATYANVLVVKPSPQKHGSQHLQTQAESIQQKPCKKSM